MRQLRLDMIADRPSELCERCYQGEALGQTTFRTTVNASMAHHFDLVAETGSDGRVERLNLPYLDIRFSNLCNFRCRICNPDLSSDWHEDAKALGYAALSPSKVIRATGDADSLWQELAPLLLRLERIQFAGGEPLLMAEHYRVLEALIENQRFDVFLSYNTNLSVLSYKGHDIPDLWRRFGNVFIMASLDGTSQRGEYMRKGTNWDTIVANRERLLEACPNIDFRIYPTVSVMNVLHLPDFYREWLEAGYIEPGGIYFNILYEPPVYDIRNMPAALKSRVEASYREFIDGYLADLGNSAVHTRMHFEAVLHHMAGEGTELTSGFRAVTRQLDAIRGEDFEQVFPEIAALMAV
jgi:sulfatase maturation enzyme AslB (radical SAM superfamily)